MLITDLLEDLQRHGEEEIEFYLTEGKDKEDMIKLEVFLCDGKYLYIKAEENGELVENVIVLALTRAKNA
jgi:hypothetical protein